MTFTTYENRSNPHVAIHCDGCNQIMKRGGFHKHKQGFYKYHATYAIAKAYAVGTGLPIIYCSFCNPPTCSNNITKVISGE